MAWCESRPSDTSASQVLRTPHHRPRTLAPTRIDLVNDVVRARPKTLHVVSSANDLSGGRLLAYFPDAELADGAGEDETDGFLDLSDAPPWDTWVALFDDGDPNRPSAVYLIAWIPSRFIALVDRGIAVNMAGSIAWLSETNTSVAGELRSAGLLI